MERKALVGCKSPDQSSYGRDRVEVADHDFESHQNRHYRCRCFGSCAIVIYQCRAYIASQQVNLRGVKNLRNWQHRIRDGFFITDTEHQTNSKSDHHDCIQRRR